MILFSSFKNVFFQCAVFECKKLPMANAARPDFVMGDERWEWEGTAPRGLLVQEGGKEYFWQCEYGEELKMQPIQTAE